MSVRSPVALRSGARSAGGHGRRTNEDTLYAGRHLFAVADGAGTMGLGGDAASALVVETLKVLDARAPAEEPEVALLSRVEAANEALRLLCDEHSSGAFTTLTAMLFSGPRLALAHIGDSRAYLLRDQVLYFITEDHTIARLKVEAGEMTEEEAAGSRYRHLMTRFLDGRPDQVPDLYVREARIGDRYLLCTDGLAGVDARSIHHELSTVEDPQTAAEALVDRAAAADGPDDITCVVVDVRG